MEYAENPKKSRRKKSIMKIKYIVIGVLVLLIPVLLNIFLQAQSPNSIKVISDSNTGPGLWLMFWGSYLAALGSTVMAYVAYMQNKQLQTKSNERFNFETRHRQYEQLERFVKYSCSLHSAYYFNTIVYLSQEHPIEAIEKCEKYIFDLEFITSSICHYKSLFRDPEMQSFGDELCYCNNLFLDQAQKLLTQLLNTNEQSIDVNSFKKNAIMITQLQENGHKLLNAEMERIFKIWPSM